MSALGYATVAVGGVLASRPLEMASRFFGAGLVGIGLLMIASPAWADQNVIARDNMQVDCKLSQSNLTRISLRNDKFATVSKIASANPSEELVIVNEPQRGDIYLSVPPAFGKPAVSFFGTTERGYVYKFVCQVGGADAEQIFVTNELLEQQAAGTDIQTAALDPREASVNLMQAMYQQQPAVGYEVRQDNLDPVRVGNLNVRLISEYRGLDLNGKQLLVQNVGKEAVAIDEATFKLASLVSLSALQPTLKPGESTSVFLVLKTGS